MNSTNFKQYDSRWGGLPYPNRPWTIANSGCGEVAICNVIIEMAQYANETPATIQPYCVQYAAPGGDGTYWSGIPAMLKHYGFTEVMEHDTMPELFAELAKGNRVAVYLMGSRAAGSKGVHWTSGGHFVSSVAYKKEGGEDWVYMKDPNSTSDLRNGWITYNGNIRGACLKVWSGKLNGSPSPTPTPPSGDHYPGPYPVVRKYLEPGDRGENVTRLQNYLNWYTDGQFFRECGGADGIYGKNTLRYVNKMLTDFFGASEADGLVGNKTIAKMKAYTKPVKPEPTPSKSTKVIDVSYVQKSIDWAKVKASGIDGAMVRCGYRGYETARLNEDDMFLSHIKGAAAAGLKTGVYFFTEAINYAEGKEEAEFTLKLIEKSGVNLYYPIAVDTEYIGEDDEGVTPRADNISVSDRTDAIKGFCEGITARGGKPMIYASTNWFENKLDMSKLPYDCWCAQYYHKCEYEGRVVMWQYTSEGMVSGVQGVVDMNDCYITSPTPKPTPKPQPTPDPKHYGGSYPTEAEIRAASNAGIHNNVASWCKEIADGGKYHYVQFTDDEYTHKCPICTKRTYDLGWNCIGYSFASWRHNLSTPIPCTCNCGVIYNGLGDNYYYMSNDEVLKSMQSRIGVSDIQLIRNDNERIPESMLQKGDLLMFYNGKTYIHMGVYIGNGKISDDTSGSGVRYGASYSAMKCLFAIRYTGTRSYIKKGDQGEAVTKLQDYLNWYTDGRFYKECGGADGIFGANTDRYVKQMQTDFFGASEADGTVGNKTIAKMKEVVR